MSISKKPSIDLSKDFVKQELRTCSSSKPLPGYAWRSAIQYLPKRDKEVCALASRRLCILVHNDPSADLDKMHERRTLCVRPLKPLPQAYGPTHRFLFSDTESSQEEASVKSSIYYKMGLDPTVAKAVLSICEKEMQHPEYIPLYHAINLSTFILTLFTRIFHSITEISLSSTPFVRFPSSNGFKTIENLFSTYPPEQYEYYDWDAPVQQHLLSCNRHLFANFRRTMESTWSLYVGNGNISPPTKEKFFQDLCEKYHLPATKDNLDQLSDLMEKVDLNSRRFARLNLTEGGRDTETAKGMILQFLIPPAVLEKVAYPCYTFGRLFQSDLSLSERCLALRLDPEREPDLQVRLLAQSIMVPDHHIKVFTHGCGGFFSDEDPVKPDIMSSQDWAEQQKCIAQKKEIFAQIKELFTKMLLPIPKKRL